MSFVVSKLLIIKMLCILIQIHFLIAVKQRHNIYYTFSLTQRHYNPIVITIQNYYCIQIGVEIVWDSRSTKEWILGRVSGILRGGGGADDIIINLAKEREPGIEIIERNTWSLIITGYYYNITLAYLSDFFLQANNNTTHKLN